MLRGAAERILSSMKAERRTRSFLWTPRKSNSKGQEQYGMLRQPLHSRSTSEWEYECNKSLVPDPINISYRIAKTDYSYIEIMVQ